MNTKNKYDYLIKNTFLFTVASLGTSLVSFLLFPFYSRVLSAAEIGILELIEVSSLLLFYICSLDFADVTGRFSLDKSLDKNMVLKISIVFLLKTVLIACGVVCITFIFDFFKFSPRFYLYLFIQYLLLAVSLTFSQFLKGLDKVDLLTKSSLYSVIIKALLMILLMKFFSLGIDGFYFACFASSCVSIILMISGLSGCSILKTRIDKSLEKEMMLYSIPLAINALGWWVAQGVDRYFVSFFKGYDINGIYSTAYKIPSVTSIMCGIFNQAFSISAVKEIDQKDRISFFESIGNGYHSLLEVLSSLLIFVNRPATRILFPDSLSSAALYTPLLVISAMFAGLAGFLGGICDALKKTKVLAISTLISAIINIVLDIILIPLIGPLGAAIATIISMYCIYIIRAVFVGRFLKAKLNMFKNHFAFILLLIQLLFEKTTGILFFIQLLVFGTIIFIYKNELIFCVKRVFSSAIKRIKEK